MKICFLTKHEITWGSSRERIGAYLDFLKARGHRYKVIYVIPNRLSRIWIGDRGWNPVFNKIYSIWHSRLLKNLKLLWIIMSAGNFDLILIQKVNLAYPLVCVLRSRNKNIIFDFDDLCFRLKNNTGFAASGPPKVLRLYKHIIAGNRRLAELAASAKGRANVTIIPTAIDCNAYSYKDRLSSGGPVVIGWSGSGENHLRNLKIMVEPLKELSKEYDFIFKLVGAMGSGKIKGLFEFLGPKFISIDWVKLSELPGIIKTFDIGVMPLEDDDASKSKCGFKALQYMASGVAVVISPVGVNSEIVQDGVNGFLAKDKSDWVEKLSLLIKDEEIRQSFAAKGRETVEDFYPLANNLALFINTLETKAA